MGDPQDGMDTVVAAAAVADEPRPDTPVRVHVGRALCVCLPLILWSAPLEIDARMKHTLAIASFMILAWITEAIDYALAGFIGCYLYWALGVVPFAVAFSGFATDTPWCLFGAALFGAMATKTGLARRIAFVVMERVGKTYARILLGLIITDFLLTFVIPSGIARVVVMSAVALGLVEAFGVGPGSNIGRAMFLIVTYTASIFDKMIIAGAASITARGAIERVGGVEVLWSQWFFAYLPCDIITILVAWRLTLWLYPPEKRAFTRDETAYLYHIFLASEISMLGTSLPVLMNFAKSHAMDPLLVGMIWTFGAGGKLFAYQSGVLIVGMSYGYFGSRDLFRLGFLLTLVQCVLLLLLVFFYWPLIGLR